MDTFGAALIGGLGETGFKFSQALFLWGKQATYSSDLCQECIPGWDDVTAMYTSMILRHVKTNVQKDT